jgi:hypothetical protein
VAIPTYIDRDTLKLAVGMKLSDTTRDPLLDIAISGAARAIFRKTGQRRFDKDAVPTTRLVPTVNRTVHDRVWRDYRLIVPDIASLVGMTVKSETGIQDFTFTAIAPDDASKPVTGILGTFPDRVLITAQFGWPEVPGDIVQAHLIQAMRYYRRKDSPEGIAGTAEWGLVRVPRLDPDVAEMLEDYCYPAVG